MTRWEMNPLYREEEKGKLVELKNALTFRLRGRVNVSDERVKLKIKALTAWL